MTSEGSVTRWLGQVPTGDDEAAQQLWQRYFGRLVGLARAKLKGAERGAAETVSLPAASRSLDDYEIIAEIGRGGMGVVYRARQVSLNRPVAVKMVLAGQLASEEEVRRSRTEAEIVAGLNHPG